jgi:hypothetical protein
MSRSLTLVFLTLVVILPTTRSAAQSYKVFRHKSLTDSDITETNVRNIMSEALQILSRNDGGGDVACTGATFEMSGSLGVFNDTDGNINTKEKLAILMAKPPGIYIVRSITCCGQYTNNPSIVGCTDGGRGVTVIQAGLGTAASQIWMHEHGHMKGLDDRDCGSDGPFNFIMCGIISTDSVRVDLAECSAYRQQAGQVLAAANQSHNKADQPATHGVANVTDLVHRVYVHGMPENVGSRIDKSQVPELIKMLDDPKEKEWRQNIVVLLGFTGDAQVVPALITYFKAGLGSLDLPEERAKRAVPYALGTLSRTADSREALDFLIAGVTATKNLEQALKWKLPNKVQEQASEWSLKEWMIPGLTISARPEAIRALKDLQQTIEKDDKSVSIDAKRMVDEAIQDAQRRGSPESRPVLKQ